MKAQWGERGLVALSQQRIPMTEGRNFIKENLDPGHVALVTMNFTEAQQKEIDQMKAWRKAWYQK